VKRLVSVLAALATLTSCGSTGPLHDRASLDVGSDLSGSGSPLAGGRSSRPAGGLPITQGAEGSAPGESTAWSV
jgi:hypothetical protein